MNYSLGNKWSAGACAVTLHREMSAAASTAWTLGSLCPLCQED